MVLETLMTVKDAIKNPWHMVIFGAVISLISLGIANFVFPESSGLLTVFLITMISAPFMWKLFKYEEWHEESDFTKERTFSEKFNPVELFSRHLNIFLIYSAYFIGIVAALSFVFWALPGNVAENVFNDQTAQIEKISNITGQITFADAFSIILTNNLIVMTISFIFALLLGLGVTFIIVWNGSVLAAAVGSVAKLSGASTAIVKYLPHGIFEIAAYIVVAIAGGVLSVAISKHGTKFVGAIVLDTVLMLAFAVILLVIGAFIESSSF